MLNCVDGRSLGMIHNVQSGFRSGRLYGASYASLVLDTKDYHQSKKNGRDRVGLTVYSALALNLIPSSWWEGL
jgi:hypothetical protein